MFAQSVYLMFSSMYVCKETVEHLLLSVGEGHHHHHDDEEPTTLTWVAIHTYALLDESRFNDVLGSSSPSFSYSSLCCRSLPPRSILTITPGSSMVSIPCRFLSPSEPIFIYISFKATSYHLPPIRSIIRNTFSRFPSIDKRYHSTPTSPAHTILSNSFILSPILFCASILLAEVLMPL